MNVEIGKPAIDLFNPDLFCDAIEQMIETDEVERAIWMLDNFPGWYRENPFPRAEEIRRILYKNLMTVSDYAQDSDEEVFRKPEEILESDFIQPRFDVIHSIIKSYNKEGKSPRIHELGPASFWLPSCLKYMGCEFSYAPITIQKQASERFHKEYPHLDQEKTTDDPKIFVCFEVIEHLWHPKDIVHYYNKLGIDADYVLLSTPLNTLYGGCHEGYKNRVLGHLRTYTKQDFINFGIQNFLNRNWQWVPGYMQVLIGAKK